MQMNPTSHEFSLLLYMADWCLDSVLAGNALARAGIPFTAIDVDSSEEASDAVRALCDGRCRIPVAIVKGGAIPDEVLIEPGMRAIVEAARRHLQPAT
jgi:glutaredoxin